MNDHGKQESQRLVARTCCLLDTVLALEGSYGTKLVLTIHPAAWKSQQRPFSIEEVTSSKLPSGPGSPGYNLPSYESKGPCKLEWEVRPANLDRRLLGVGIRHRQTAAALRRGSPRCQPSRSICLEYPMLDVGSCQGDRLEWTSVPCLDLDIRWRLQDRHPMETRATRLVIYL
jgi:hypothetical protein